MGSVSSPQCGRIGVDRERTRQAATPASLRCRSPHQCGTTQKGTLTEPDITDRLLIVDPFGELPPEVVINIRDHVSVRTLDPGEVLFIEGDETGMLAVVSDGRLEVEIGSGASAFEVAEFGPGAVVGEIAVIPDAV